MVGRIWSIQCLLAVGSELRLLKASSRTWRARPNIREARLASLDMSKDAPSSFKDMACEIRVAIVLGFEATRLLVVFCFVFGK